MASSTYYGATAVAAPLGGERWAGADGAGSAARWRVLRGHAALWAALIVISALIVTLPQLPVAWFSPALAVALATVAAVVGLAVLQFGVFRYSVFGYLPDLLSGLAFGTLAVANLALRVAWPATDIALPFDTSLYLVLFARALAAALLLLGLAHRHTVHRPAARTAMAWRWGTAVLALGAGGAIAIGHWQAQLPPLVAAAGRALVDSSAQVADVLPGQLPGLVVANVLLSVAMFVAAVGYVALSRRLADPHLSGIAAALSLLFFGQFHSLLFPPAPASYVSSADAFRLGAYVALFYSLVRRIGREIEDRALGEERLRLSRELHDGLAQQLGLLHLRLGRATAARTPQAQKRDLELARRLVEAALLEARQVITTLRTGTVTWEELARTVGVFTDEFAQNHDVDVRLSLADEAPSTLVGAGIGAELLRLAHEALSNAVRHGGATTIDVALALRDSGVALEIRDEGRGFDPAAIAVDGQSEGAVGLGGGLGLRSMRERVERRGGTVALESAVGRGTVVRTWLPLDSAARPALQPTATAR